MGCAGAVASGIHTSGVRVADPVAVSATGVVVDADGSLVAASLGAVVAEVSGAEAVADDDAEAVTGTPSPGTDGAAVADCDAASLGAAVADCDGETDSEIGLLGAADADSLGAVVAEVSGAEVAADDDGEAVTGTPSPGTDGAAVADPVALALADCDGETDCDADSLGADSLGADSLGADSLGADSLGAVVAEVSGAEAVADDDAEAVTGTPSPGIDGAAVAD